MKYSGDNLRAISFPLGGIGTGSIGLAGNGALIDWEIRNKPNKRSLNDFSFFAVKAEKDGKFLSARVLNGDLTGPYHGDSKGMHCPGYGFGVARGSMAGVPHFKTNTFEGSYPFAKVSFERDSFPGRPSVTAFNPFIPSNADDSGIPAAFFTLEINNDTADTLDYTFVGSIQSMFPAGTNRAFSENGVLGVTMSGNDAPDSPEYGTLALSTDCKDSAAQEYWYAGGWFDALSVFWHDFCAPGHMKARTYTEGSDAFKPGMLNTCSVSAHLCLKPGETGSVRFLISWCFPNYTNYWRPMPEEECGSLSNTWQNYYAKQFPDAKAASLYAFKNWNRLESETRLFHDALHSSTLPEYCIDAISSTMSVLKTPTCLRLPDGSFYGWEGLGMNSGSCEGSCTHVWNYAYALPFLFPALERTLRETNYKYNEDPAGGMHFRTQLPLGRKYHSFRPCADGQFGDVMKVYREWKILGDTEWLRALWPAVKKSIEYAWSHENPDKWDPNRDGVLEGRQHHTLDMELFGPSGWLNGFYLGALKAGCEMARALDDTSFADELESIYASGRKWVDENLFNGEFYTQQVDLNDRAQLDAYEGAYPTYWNAEAGELKYQMCGGCSIDQVTAQWHANNIGLGDILDPEHVRSALKSIYKYNFMCMREHFNPCRLYSVNDECGTVMCTWPEGVQKPVIPVPYAEETMYGFEYEAAVSMLQNGMVKEGLELVAAIRDRHNGANRDPWNEMECGSNYARSMAAYSILPALSGFRFDLTRGFIGFKPIINEEAFSAFWALDGVWGKYDQNPAQAALRVLYGSIALKRFNASDRLIKNVTLNRKPVAFTQEGFELVFASPLTLNADDVLILE